MFGNIVGGVLSPLLAHSYRHEVGNKWVETVGKPRLQGRALLIRSAEELVGVFAKETAARRGLEVVPKRCGQ